MKSQKVLFFCCLMGSQLLAMEEKSSQALAVKKPDGVSVFAEDSSQLGFWGKTGVTVGAVGGLATLGLGAGLFFAPKEERNLGYKERVTKVLARIGALLRWHAPAGKNDARVAPENAESTDGLGKNGVLDRAAQTDEKSCDEMGSSVPEMQADFQKDLGILSHVTGNPLFDVLKEASEIYEWVKDAGFSRYSTFFNCIKWEIGTSYLNDGEVLALLKKCIDDLEVAKRSPYYQGALKVRGLDASLIDDALATFKKDWQSLKVLSVLSVAKAASESGFKGSIDGYQRGFAQALQRVVAQEEVLGLLKKSIDDLEDARRNPRFAEAARLCGYDESFIDYVLVRFKKDLQALTKTEAKSGAAVVGNAETQKE